MSTINCEKLCEDEQTIINNLIGNNGTVKEIQDATRDHLSCMMNCNNRKDNATRGVGGGGGIQSRGR